jgi:hypothetical protein
MKSIDPRRWARPGDLLRSNRDILTGDGAAWTAAYLLDVIDTSDATAG